MKGARSPEKDHGRTVRTNCGNASAHTLTAYTGAARSCVFLYTALIKLALLSPFPVKSLCSENVVAAFRKAAHAAWTSGRRSGFQGSVRTAMKSASMSW